MEENVQICNVTTSNQWKGVNKLIFDEGWSAYDENTMKLVRESPGTNCLIAIKNEVVIGALIWTKMNDLPLNYVGIYIVGKEYRGEGSGKKLWKEMKNKAHSNLIWAIDSISDMTSKYRSTDFPYPSDNLILALKGEKVKTLNSLNKKLKEFQPKVEIRKIGTGPIDKILIDQIIAFDFTVANRDRSEFLPSFLSLSDVKSFVAFDGDTVAGYGSISPTMQENNSRLGPVYADNLEIALLLLKNLLETTKNEYYSLFVPKWNSLFVDFMINDAGHEILMKLERSYSEYFVEKFNKNKVFASTRHINQADC